MHPLISDVKNLVFDTLFPVQCLSCNQEGLFLCLDCQKQLKQLPHQECIVCRMLSVNGITHSQCQRDNSPDGLISLFDYHDPLLAQAIIWGKYKFLPDVYHILGKLLAQFMIDNNYPSMINQPVLMAVPLAKERLRWRGFNQSEIIVQELSQHLNWPITQIIKRVKNTKTQKDLTKTQRIANISKSFRMIDVSRVQDQNVILVDDVITTGATILEAAKLVRTSGANQVWCLTLARD